MKRAFLFSLLAILFVLILPLRLTPVEPQPTEGPAGDTQSGAVSGEQGEATASRTLTDADTTLRVLSGGEVREMSMSEYLPMALAGEMPASFHSEALKAQAVALRSYALHYKENPKSVHPEADVCTDSGCCTAARSEEEAALEWGSDADSYGEKIAEAVRATDGQYLALEQEAILAMFHSSSSGATESVVALRTEKPYLQSVSSPETGEDVRNLVSSVELSAEDFRETVLRSFPGAELDGEPSGWVGAVTPSAGGRVGSISIGSQDISGLAMRQLFSLRSTDFTLKWTGECFLFTVQGYGHGLGMSQYGANAMAKAGADWKEILTHYYTGVTIGPWSGVKNFTKGRKP